MNCSKQPQDEPLVAASACSTSRRKRRKASKAVARAVLRAFVPSATEARVMLAELAEATGLPRRLRASLIGVQDQVLRRWEDGTRDPCQAACRLIGVVCDTYHGCSPFEIADLLSERARKVAGDKSRPASEHAEALALVAGVGLFRANLSAQIMALLVANEAGKQTPA